MLCITQRRPRRHFRLDGASAHPRSRWARRYSRSTARYQVTLNKNNYTPDFCKKITSQLHVGLLHLAGLRSVARGEYGQAPPLSRRGAGVVLLPSSRGVCRFGATQVALPQRASALWHHAGAPKPHYVGCVLFGDQSHVGCVRVMFQFCLCLCVCESVCVCVNMQIYIYIYVYICINMYIFICIYIRVFRYIHIYKCIYIF